MSGITNRRVSQIEPRPATELSVRVLDYLDRDEIILLGDPGAGKTHCLRTLAIAEKAAYYTVPQFVARNGDNSARTVYLDGLDEYRSRTSARDSNLAITLLQILRATGSPRLRLSCRFADWLGSTDLELFKDYCGAGQYAVLALEPLNEQEALDILVDYGTIDPEKFLAEAKSRRMDWTVSNPQNLLMLADVVTHSGWPSTKHELYEQWSLRHLSEHKATLQNSQLGTYSAKDLISPAGAACAALLISDVVGIRLGPSSDIQTPSYKSVPYANQEAVLAGLSRTAFSSIQPDVITYIHRTVAEYLAARWLGEKIQEGLPLSRVQALLGVDAHPSPSLRGLHAWLPVFVPLQAATLISKDPIGILTYGDAASLPPSQKNDLIKSLAAVAAENGWFLAQGASTYGLEGLSSPETAEQLIAILRSPAEPAPLKGLALRAISVGSPLPIYRPQLENILADSTALETHRQIAFNSLLGYGPDGIAAAVRAYRSSISGEAESIALRSEIVGELYGRPFGPSDVVALLKDAASKTGSRVVGELWPLVHGIAAQNLLDVLEEYERSPVSQEGSSEESHRVYVLLLLDRMVGRLYEAIPEDDLDRIDRLVAVVRRAYERNLIIFDRSIRLADILSKRPRLVELLVDSAVRHLHEFKHPATVGYTLFRVTGGMATVAAVAERLSAEFDNERSGTEFTPDVIQKYEALGRCLYGCGPEALSLFERFVEIGKTHPECEPLLRALMVCAFEPPSPAPSPYQAAVDEYRVSLLKSVESNSAALQRGENPGLQGELAKLYFGFYSGDAEHRKRKQLILGIGEPLAKAVEQGFLAMVSAQTPPTLAEIAKESATNRLFWHWYAFLAGVDLLWDETHDLSGLPGATIEAAFALSRILDTFDEVGKHVPGTAREWSRRIANERPELVEQVYSVLLGERLRTGENIRSLLNNVSDAMTTDSRARLALQLLLDYEPSDRSDLQNLCLLAAESQAGRRELAIIAQERNLATAASRPLEIPLWIVVGFALVGGDFETKLSSVAPTHREILWIIRAITQPFVRTSAGTPKLGLSIQQIELVIRIFGLIFPNTERVSGGWGDESGWDAAQYLGGLMTAISTQSDSAAGECLQRLLACEDLVSYRPWISSRLSEQRDLNRQSRYEKPTWDATCAALRGGAPANIEDLQALFLEDLVDAARDIRGSNLDKYKVYWGGGTRYVLGKPHDEDFCRDRLMEFLRQRLAPIGLLIEPEGHMAADKRSDMVVLVPNNLKLPVEVKRDTHPELWSAAKNQLERLYTRDPNAYGYGVYLVFYFGAARGRGITANPEGILVSDSAEALQSALSSTIPTEHRDRISCFVVDVSPPALPTSRTSKSKAKKPARKRSKVTPSSKRPGNRRKDSKKPTSRSTRGSSKKAASGKRERPPKKS
jgi:hypothetical protein